MVAIVIELFLCQHVSVNMSLEIPFLFFHINYENSRTMRKEHKNRLFEEIQNINWQLLGVIELSYFHCFQCYK